MQSIKEIGITRTVVNLNDQWNALKGLPFAVYLVTALSEDLRTASAYSHVSEDFAARNPAEADRILAKGLDIPEGLISSILWMDLTKQS